MAIYEAKVISKTFTILAKDIDEAESKYDAYYWDKACPCLIPDCECLEVSDEVSHSMEKIND